MPRISPTHYRKLVRVLELEGFALVRQRGDHMVFTKPGISRPVVVPRHDPLPVFIIKNILRTARITRERYFELLERV
ncbi:MAG TPA: type II toxin-antitoxin system HicA family toxin [Candidatus Acidoferrales bacterium]